MVFADKNKTQNYSDMQILLGSPHLPLVFFSHRNTERVFTVFLQHSAPEAAFKLNNLILYEFGCEFVWNLCWVGLKQGGWELISQQINTSSLLFKGVPQGSIVGPL